MIKSVFMALCLVAVSSVALATTYECSFDPDAPGNPSYLVFFKSELPGVKSQAVILSRQTIAGQPQWALIAGDASVVKAADGGPVSIGYVDAKKVDWSQPELKDECFYFLKNSYWFTLSRGTSGVTGTVTSARNVAMNPNKTNCPRIVPPVPAKHNIVCQSF